MPEPNHFREMHVICLFDGANYIVVMGSSWARHSLIDHVGQWSWNNAAICNLGDMIETKDMLVH